MEELIDRYIYAVTQQLPEDMKGDVSKELRSNIEDMLPEDYTENDIKAVLEQLGNPWKIAEEYQPKQRFLIGPALYGKYIKVLKLVMGIVMTVVAATTIIGWVFMPATSDYSSSDFSNIVMDLITAVFQGGLQAAFWVTLTFVAVERGWFGKTDHTPMHTITDEPWSVSDLPTIPVHAAKIPRSGTIISIIATMVFTSVIYFQPKLIGIIHTNSDGMSTFYSLLETDRLQSYLPLILILALIQIALFVWKYIVQYWNVRLWTVHTLASVLIGALIIIMINDPALIREGFFSGAAQLFQVDLSMVMKQWDIIVRVIVVSVVVITVWDAIDTYLKTRKKYKA